MKIKRFTAALLMLALVFTMIPMKNYHTNAAAYELRASSEQGEHTAQMACDGNPETYWQAQGAGSLICDLREIRRVTSYKQYFDEDDVWFFTVEGSLDGKSWAVLADYSKGASGRLFSDSVEGFYRYVKMNASSARRAASSREFTISSEPLSRGTNVALGMKGYSGSWVAGFEHESAFDGDTGSYYCANDGGYPQYCGVRWEYSVLVRGLTIRLQDYGTYEFEVEAKKSDESTVMLVPREKRTGMFFSFNVEGIYSDIVYRVYSGPGWANLAEMEVFGFRDLASPLCSEKVVPERQGDYDVYDFGCPVYLAKAAGEISDDGQHWEPWKEGTTRYLRTEKEVSDSLYGTCLMRDLALGLRGSVSDYASEAYSPEQCTKNPEHEDGKNSYWCAAFYNGEHWLELDLGRLCLVERIEQQFMDEGNYLFEIEASADGEHWNKLLAKDEVHTGRIFAAETGENKLFRYIRLSFTDCGWANSNRLSVYGYGSPQRESWWQRESGVVRYYPKKQQNVIGDIINKLDEYRANGFKVLEIHQPYEGQGDIWAGLGATNNYQADPVNGTLDDWSRLIEEAHKRDMYVFMFGNVGYARVSAEFFRKACLDYANGVESEERDWFLFREDCPDPSKWFWSDTAGAYYYGYWGENGQIPNYNFESESWREECKNYLTYWADFGFDGIALDAPPAYYFGSSDAEQVTYDYITHPLSAYNIMILPEGTGDYNYIYGYHYTAIQNYNMGNWGGSAWSLGIDAITDHNARTIDDMIKSGRDNAVSLGGTAIAPLCFEQKYVNVEDYKREAEAALLCTSGHMAFLHSGTDEFIGQDIIEEWSEGLRSAVFDLFKLQNGWGGFNAGGMRSRIPTNDDTVYYAYCKSDVSGAVKSLCVFNYAADSATIQVDLAGTGYGRKFMDLLTGKIYETSDGKLTVTLKSGGYLLLGEVWEEKV